MTPLRLFLAATLLLVGVAQAADVPKLQWRVNDYAGVLQPNTRADLESSLKRYERETTHQIAVLTVPSLGGETIEAFSLRVANAWALGRKGVDNGVLVTLAPTEHQVRIELGNGMKRYVSDSDAKSIVEEVMIPSFRRGEYDIGLTRGIEKLFEACRAFEARAASFANAGQFTVIVVDTRVERLELFSSDNEGVPFRRLDRLDAWLKSQNRHLRFAMNAGMFEPDLSPVGLLVERQREIKPLNLADGRGNFFLKPNGVFFVTAAGPSIVRSSKYSMAPDQVLLATQSGPLLVEDGVINPAFSSTSTSKHIRNGVGVRGNEAVFVISSAPVTFYEFATYFRDQLHCRDALYFDGVVSSLFYPESGRKDSTVDLGPMIGVVR